MNKLIDTPHTLAIFYTYGCTTHCPNPIKGNIFIKEMINLIVKLFPEVIINSVLVNYYPENKSNMKYHSDDEVEIVDSSYIFTLSLGSSRLIAFRRRGTGPGLDVCRVLLQNWDLLIFSKQSQTKFKHSILADGSNPVSDNRLSLSFRQIE